MHSKSDPSYSAETQTRKRGRPRKNFIIPIGKGTSHNGVHDLNIDNDAPVKIYRVDPKTLQ